MIFCFELDISLNKQNSYLDHKNFSFYTSMYVIEYSTLAY